MNPPQTPLPSADRMPLALLFLSVFIPFVSFNHSDGWNQGARLAELHAIVLKGTVAIDEYHTVTGDKAFIDGHYYSEKAPAIVAAAVPAFAAAVAIERSAGIDPDSKLGWEISEWVATAGSVALIASAGAVAFFVLLRQRFEHTVALVATYALFLGTITLPYATALFAHAGTIGFLTMGLWAALGRKPHDYLAGALCGLAVASEYPAIIACAGVFLFVSIESIPRGIKFAVGSLPAVAMILINNALITGSPLRVGYGSNPAFPGVTASNAFGFGLPQYEPVRNLLFSEFRGLFVWCPVALLSVPGVLELYRRHRAAALMVIAVSVLVLLQVSSFEGWNGGNAVGPRYLAPAMPFIGLAMAYGIDRYRTAGVTLTLLSVALMTAVTAIAIDPPKEITTPMQTFYVDQVRAGHFARSLGDLVAAPVWFSTLAPLAISLSLAWAASDTRSGKAVAA